MPHQGLGSEMSEGADSLNPKQKYGDLKAPLCMVPWSAIIYLAMAFKEGARKYGPFNWRTKKIESMTYVSALMRHVAAWVDGEENDPESGNPHLAHALACLAILVDAKESGNLVDSRPVPGPAPGMLVHLATPSEPIMVRGTARDLSEFDVISEQPDHNPLGPRG